MVRTLIKKSKKQHLLDYVEKYRKEAGDDEPISLIPLARKALKDGFVPHRTSPEIQLAREFKRALRDEKFTDPQGREIRVWHSTRHGETVDGEYRQLVFWQEFERAEPEFMKVSVQQQRDDILHDCLRLEETWASYNDNNKFGTKLRQLHFDFTEDIVEAKHSPEYPDTRPDDLEIGDDPE